MKYILIYSKILQKPVNYSTFACVQALQLAKRRTRAMLELYNLLHLQPLHEKQVVGEIDTFFMRDEDASHCGSANTGNHHKMVIIK